LLPTTAVSDEEISDEEFAQRMRQYWFEVTPEQAKIKPTIEQNKVFCVIMDWPIKEVMSTLMSMADGTASLYTNKGLGIMGGYAAVESAKAFVGQAEQSLSYSVATTEHPYPSTDMVRFYIRTFTELRVIEEPVNLLLTKKSKLNLLFAAANQVITELIEAANKAKKQPKT
jgi:hypothetical protein